MDQNQNSSNLFNLTLDAQNSYTLRSVASWARVLGILSIIFAILCVAGGILFQQAVSRTGYDRDFTGNGVGSLGNMGMIMYIIIGLVYLMSGMFALNAGNKISTGLKTNNMEVLNRGFSGARNFFALWAVLLIIFLVLVLIGLAGRLGS